jgi:hypothetical protein
MSLSLFSLGAQAYDSAQRILTDSAPVFFSRIGGSDTNAVVSYFQAKTGLRAVTSEETDRHRQVVGRFNGYYDRKNDEENYFRYCENLLECYHRSKYLMFCNHELLSIYFSSSLDPKFLTRDIPHREGFKALIESMERAQGDLYGYTYQFAERIVFENDTLFRLFSTVLAGKKVLVISPFSESILANFPNRHGFFKRNYVYPEFDLQVYNTPITYSGLPDEFYPHENWFETLGHMKSEISKLDFDIALLSCGSYAMPLGIFIEKEMKRKAVYVGGLLQLYFGIMGRRYENRWFTGQINAENFIYPVERERYLKDIVISEAMAREAFGAYF